MGNYSIYYETSPLGGIGVHGAIVVVDGQNLIIQTYQGLATGSKGGVIAIGSALFGDKLYGYVDAGNAIHAPGPVSIEPQPLFSGTRQEVEARMSAMNQANAEINNQSFPYEIPGVASVLSAVFGEKGGNNLNSNSYISTMAAVIGVNIPVPASTTVLGQVGSAAQLLSQNQISQIRASYGPDFNIVPSGSPSPYALASYTKAPVFFETPSADGNGVSLTGLGSLSGTITLTYQDQADGRHLVYSSSGGGSANLSPADVSAIGAAGSIGGYVGGELAQLVGTNNQFAKVATASFFSTAGKLLGQEIASRNLGNADLGINVIGTEFAQSAISAVSGYAGAEAGKAIFQSLGIDPALGSIIGGTIGAAVTLTAIAEVADSLGIATQLSADFVHNLEEGLPAAGVAVFEAVTGLNPNVNAFGGSPEDVEIGSAVGGLIGTIVGLPGLGTVAGLVLGQFVGSIVGSVFGEPSVGPNVGATLQLSSTVQQNHHVFISQAGYDNNPPQGMIDTITGLGDTIAAMVNAELAILAGGSSNVGVSLTASATNVVQVRIFVNADTGKADFYDGLSFGTNNFPNSSARDFGNGSDGQNAYNNVLNDAVIRQLSLTTIAGGTPGMVSALDNSLLSYDSSYLLDATGNRKSSETIGEVNYDLQAISDYNLYVQNKVAFLVGFAAREASLNQATEQEAQTDGVAYTDRDAATDWNAEMTRGALLQRVWSFASGQGALTINGYSASNEGNEGLLTFQAGINATDATLLRNGNDLTIAVAGKAGDSVTIQNAFLGAAYGVAELEFHNTAGGLQTILFLPELIAAFPANFSGPLSVSNIEFIFDTEGRTENHNSQSTIIHVDRASYNLAGTANTVVLTGSSGVLVLDGDNTNVFGNGNGNAVAVTGGSATITLDGQQNRVAVSGDAANVTLNGDDGEIIATGNGEVLTANGPGTSITVKGNRDTVDTGDGSILVDDGISGLVTEGVSNAVAFGNSTSATVEGSQMVVTATGQGDTLVIDGAAETYLDTGTGNRMTLNGQGKVTLSGSSARKNVTDIANTTVAADNNVNGSASGIYLLGKALSLEVNGVDNQITIGGSSNALLTSGSTIIVSDQATDVQVAGGDNSVTVGSNVQGLIGSSGGVILTVVGSGSTISSPGSYGTVSVGGHSNFVTVAGQNDTVNVNGSNNWVELSGADGHIFVTGTAQTVQANGTTIAVADNSSLTIAGSLDPSGGFYDFSDGDIIEIGNSVSLTATGGGNWVQAASGDTVTLNGTESELEASGSGNVVTFAGTGSDYHTEGYATLNNSTLNLTAGSTVALTGNGNVVAASSASGLSVVGTSNTIDATGAHLSFTGPAQPGPLLATRGFAFPAEQPGDYNNATATSSLAALKATGANSVEIVDTQFVANLTSNSIAPSTATASDADLIAEIQQAQSDGLQVLLKPHLNSLDGTWSALLAPTDPATFFASYQTFIVHYAEIAQETGVQTFSVGNELQSLTGSQYLPYWTNIIDAVRQVYSGDLTYASAAFETGTVSFWSQLDVIGANAYERVTNQDDPSLAQLEAGWTQPVPQLSNDPFNDGPNADFYGEKTDTKGNAVFTSYTGVSGQATPAGYTSVSPMAFYQGLSAEFGKPVLFTEAGYASVNATNLLDGDGRRSGTTYVDYRQQAMALQAALSVWSQQGGNWLQGAYLWSWNPNPESVTADDASVQGKPALNVVTSFFSPVASSTATLNAVTGNGNTILLGAGQGITLVGNTNLITDVGKSGGQEQVILTGNANSFFASGGASDLSLAGDDNHFVGADGNASVTVAGNGNVLVGGAGEMTFTSQSGSGNTLQAGAGVSNLTATGNANLLEGGTSFYAVLAASGNQNTLQGGSGTNTLIVSGDSNVLTSGGGYEEVDVRGSDNSLDAYDSNVSVSLTGNGNLFTGGSNYAAVFIDGNDNVIMGGSQVTSISVRSGTGNTFSAGLGFATLDYSAGPQPVQVNLATGTASSAGSSSIDTIEGINALTIGSNSAIRAGSNGTNLTINGEGSTLQGGDGFDVLASNGDGNTLVAGAGGGYLTASGGSNLLEGGSGYAVLTAYGNQNTFQGGTGTNTFVSYGGHNVLTGGGGYEDVTLYGDDSTVHAGASNMALAINGNDNQFVGGSDYASVHVSGSGNTLTGGSAATDFKSLVGGGNTFEGGTGYATLDYSGNPLAASVNLAAGTAAFAGSSSVDTLSKIALVAVGSNSAIVGDSGSDSLYIIGSGSTLQGGSGNDVLTAYGQNDTLTAGSGGGILSANGTNDIYWNNPANASVTLQNNPGTGAPANQLNFASGASTEQLWFTEAGNDLQIRSLGSANTTTIQNWFSGPASQLQAINSSNGWHLDTGVSQLVQAMTNYDSSHTGFDAATASIMPTDTTLQGAIAAAWHH